MHLPMCMFKSYVCEAYLWVCCFNSHSIPGLHSLHVFCATRQLLEPNHGPRDLATVPWVAFKRFPKPGSSWRFQHLGYQSQLLCIEAFEQT